MTLAVKIVIFYKNNYILIAFKTHIHSHFYDNLNNVQYLMTKAWINNETKYEFFFTLISSLVVP